MPARQDTADAAGPDRLGLVGRQQYETVLWRLADAQVEPLYSSLTPKLQDGGADAAARRSLWGATPEQAALLDPGAGGRLPPERAHRKRLQIEALVRLVQALLPQTAADDHGGPRPHVVDFCGGSGHTALVIAAAIPDALVTIVDFNSTALRLAAERAAELGLGNVSTHCGDVGAFSGEFSVGLALHACGAATDMAMARCRESGAAFVVSPCCVGKIAKRSAPQPEGTDADRAAGDQLALPRSGLFGSLMSAAEYISLAAAADFHSVEHPAPRRRAAKAMIELDRAAAMHERGYCVRLGKLPPEARSPKDDIIWGWPTTFAASGWLQQCWPSSAPAVELARCGFDLLQRGNDETFAHDIRWSALELLTPDATDAEREELLSRLQPLLAEGTGGTSPGGSAGVQIVSTIPGRDNVGGKSGTADARKRRKAERRAARLAQQRPQAAAATADTEAMKEPEGGSVAIAATAERQPKHFQGRNERRLLHELCHALLLRHWTAEYPASVGLRGGCVLASRPPCWPYLWDTGIHAAGPAVEAAAGPLLSQVPTGADLAWKVRSGWLSPRLCLLTEEELTASRDHDGITAGKLLQELQKDVPVDVKAVTASLEQVTAASPPSELCCSSPAGLCIEPAAAPSAAGGLSDGCISGAVRRRSPAAAWIIHQVPVVWHSGAAWRKARGLPPLRFVIRVGLQRTLTAVSN